jgi:hypothetical protein
VNYLTTEQMVVATSTFQESVSHVLGNYLPESQASLKAFVAEMILKEKPYMLVTEDGIKHAMGKVFGLEGYRDFVLMVTFTFFARFGESDTPVRSLAGNLARAVSVSGSGSNNDLSAVPLEMRRRMPSEQDVTATLESNQWLMTLLMLQLCVQMVADKK